MLGCGKFCNHKSWDLRCERGGGSKPQQPQIIMPPAPQVTQVTDPAKAAAESSQQAYESQLRYNPQLAQQAWELQQRYAPQYTGLQTQLQTQYAPQLAQAEYATQAQYGPMYRALYEQMFPTQTRLLETMGQQAQQRFESPYALTPEQQAAQEAIRQRSREQVARNIREQANVGGTLYGGRAIEREQRAMGELEQGFAEADIQRQLQQRQQALQEAIAAGQVIFPQVQQPGAAVTGGPAFTQGVTPSPDALLSAYYNNYIVQQPWMTSGTPAQPSWFGSLTRGFAGQPMGF